MSVNFETDECRPLLENGSQDGAPTNHSAYSSVAVAPANGSSQSSEDLEATKEKDGNKRMAKLLFPVGLGVFLAAMDQTIVTSSYASIGSELKRLQSTSWIATGYMLTVTSFQPLYGKLSDIFGRKQCLLFAFTIFGIGCLFCGMARTMEELIAARVLSGIGGAGIPTVITILISDIVPLRSRGAWQGTINIIFATGSAIGAPLGGILADGIGWRWAFYVQVPLTIIAFVIVSFAMHLPTKVHQSDLLSKLRRIDFFGAFTLVCGVFGLLLGLDHGGNVSWHSAMTITSLSLSVIFFILFGLTELQLAAEPFAPKRVLAHPSLLAAFLCNLFCFGANMCAIFHTALFLQAGGGASAAQAGLGIVPSVFGSVVGSLSSGLIMQQTGKYYWLTVGVYVAQFAGTIVLTTGTWLKDAAVKVVVAGLAIQALGNGSGVTTTLIAIISNAEQEDQAIATAISYLFRSMGSVLGISVGSTLVQNTLRKYLRERLIGQVGINVEDIVEHARSSLDSLASLPPTVQKIVRESYAEATRAAFLFSVLLAGLALLSSFFIREKSLLRKSE
ncbi:uncharacterized protein FOMMEDRAFT_112623 [Fomitiporia mediterranea MF3/22]|uniref:uncharacterized protein n=1 Tax=Fomitiporia mediterranea (strain MF3/22) TaxID=694068 RepID=UPI0004407342|nr:uncharacterized protein FOMMEDRAFT_112623 [Fomitiporia mediterranea MF3/22]EJD00248.1 hypothetical protein FOMMEDRAFT_112623 [Fomitiporia mediterranea MF3/22]